MGSLLRFHEEGVEGHRRLPGVKSSRGRFDFMVRRRACAHLASLAFGWATHSKCFVRRGVSARQPLGAILGSFVHLGAVVRPKALSSSEVAVECPLEPTDEGQPGLRVVQIALWILDHGIEDRSRRRLLQRLAFCPGASVVGEQPVAVGSEEGQKLVLRLAITPSSLGNLMSQYGGEPSTLRLVPSDIDDLGDPPLGAEGPGTVVGIERRGTSRPLDGERQPPGNRCLDSLLEPAGPV
jgi:hypothetical protein